MPFWDSAAQRENIFKRLEIIEEKNVILHFIKEHRI
jgi:hypothetical protein